MTIDSDSAARLTRFETSVATCLSIVPLLFAGQCLTAIGAMQASEGMQRDLGVKLPEATQLAISGRLGWLAIAIVLPIAAIVISRIKRPVASVVISTACGLVLFALSQFLTYATWLPFTELTRALR